jgi:hypothetical protein
MRAIVAQIAWSDKSAARTHEVLRHEVERLDVVVIRGVAIPA